MTTYPLHGTPRRTAFYEGVRYLGIEVYDALEMAEQTEV
jgi:hypothetical protein